ncbi:pyridoxal phosphate-dependent aminotransferase [Embleya scabrispora]|uniref:pyridoxal phosphate-dependent aminotransferase n=1 Tax=Embleya scabrispora TaxID=159449 RepID=UPI00036D2C25|nr:pyridoxal phosphate-dependent aminotransferase [Embleya scabrispora]MYS81168.1 aminotransferase class I/II-fold pyridoxal phosphate-dependent enzyme [Streptomyces sp. SID5474]
MSTFEMSAAPVALSRAASIPPSCLHDVFRSAQAWELVHRRAPIRLHVGEPAFGPPVEAIEALAAAAREGRSAYTSAEGMAELREALAAKLASENGHDTGPDRVFVAPGSCQGLAALMQSMAEPGDEILLPEIHWPIHLQQALLAGLRPRFYPLDRDFRPDPDSLADAGGERTRLILVNSPANPAGVVLDEPFLRAVLHIARRRGWRIISDEAYEHFVFEGEHVSMASLERDVPERERLVHSAFSFSKSYAMTGYRLGYIAVPDARAASALRVVQEASIVAPPTPVQYAALAALGVPQAALRNRESVRANRDRSLPSLVAAGLLGRVPPGGWYALLDLASVGLDADVFAAGLLAEHGTAVAPGRGFALRPTVDARCRVTGIEASPRSHGLLRIAFCGDGDLLATGVERLLAAASGGRA